MSNDFAATINAKLTDECQTVARTRIDLDAFLALKGEARAARWRMWDVATKSDAIIQMMGRLGLEWTAENVAEWIAKYDAKYGECPTAVEAAVLGALESAATDNAQRARQARAYGHTDEARYFQASATAAANALIEYRKGLRPEQLPSGAYVLPSRRPGEAPHLVTLDGDWTCTCKAGSAPHWPLALVQAIEQSFEDMQRFDDYDVEAEYEAAARSIGARACQFRARYLVAV